MTTQPYVEPQGDERAGWQIGDGRTHHRIVLNPWNTFLKEEGVPVFKGIGMRDSRDLPRGDWPRVGGKGTYVQLYGQGSKYSVFVVEVPPRGELKPQRHMYEERYVVLEGRGSTEVWKNDDTAMTSFEWQPWSLFSIPINANFRIINSSSSPAILVGVNTAPAAFNLYNSAAFVFDNPFNFDDRFGGNLEDYWKPSDTLEKAQASGRAMLRSNLIPDAANAYMPLDQNRAPGHRWITPAMAGNYQLQGFIAEYPSGRYAKAHGHGSGAVLLSLRGKGYSFTWPKAEGGMTPWQDGKGDLVQMQEYWPGGMISAAPGPENWYHQHFAFSQEPFRQFNLTQGVNLGPPDNQGQWEDVEEGALTVTLAFLDSGRGGNAIGYYEEDPYVREYFRERLKEEGAEFTMPPEVYTPEGAGIKVMTD
jgi:mannose-6-phosphate isomerase-like protein (cupin superfamily)